VNLDNFRGYGGDEFAPRRSLRVASDSLLNNSFKLQALRAPNPNLSVLNAETSGILNIF
jgi:hypothetical protein